MREFFNARQAFSDIDLNGDGHISQGEFRRWLKRHGVEEEDVEDTLLRYKIDEDGYISKQTFALVENVEIDNLITPSTPLPGEVQVTSTDMCKGMINVIVNLVLDEVEDGKSNKDAARNIKTSLDKRLDRLWHVTIVKGQYWAYYSHEPQNSIVFSRNGMIYIIWKTPGC